MMYHIDIYENIFPLQSYRYGTPMIHTAIVNEGPTKYSISYFATDTLYSFITEFSSLLNIYPLHLKSFRFFVRDFHNLTKQ